MNITLQKKGRKSIYSDEIFQERFNTIERTFGWEDKFKRYLLPYVVNYWYNKSKQYNQ